VQLLRFTKRNSFDVVHGHSSKGGAVARICGRYFDVPTVYTPHSVIMTSSEISRAEAGFYTFVERSLGHWATSKVIAVSEGEREFICRLRLAPEERITIIENGLQDQYFEYFLENVSCEEASHKLLTFGSVTRFSPAKAPDHLIEAFAQLVEMSPQVPVRLVIAGDGELFDKVKRQADALGLGKKVSFLGWMKDTKELLRNLDVFVLSSHYEGFSYAILEAMAAKLPIVSTNVFGTNETVAKVPGNVLVPVGDPTALAHGMNQMVIPPKRGTLRQSLQSIGLANHDYARTRFRQSEITRRTLEVYGGLCRW